MNRGAFSMEDVSKAAGFACCGSITAVLCRPSPVRRTAPETFTTLTAQLVYEEISAAV